MSTQKLATSYRLSDEAREIQRLLSAKLGINQTSVIELALRKLAEAEHIAVKPKAKAK